MSDFYESKKREKEIRERSDLARSIWSKWSSGRETFAQLNQLPDSFTELPSLTFNDLSGLQKAQYSFRIPDSLAGHRDKVVLHFFRGAIEAVRDTYPDIYVGRTNSSIHFSKEIEGIHAFVVLEAVIDGNLLVANVYFRPLIVEKDKDVPLRLKFRHHNTKTFQLYALYRHIYIVLTQFNVYIKMAKITFGVVVISIFVHPFLLGVTGDQGNELITRFHPALNKFLNFLLLGSGKSENWFSDAIIMAFGTFAVLMCYAIWVPPQSIVDQEVFLKKREWARTILDSNARQLESLDDACGKFKFSDPDEVLNSSYAMRLYLSNVCAAVERVCMRFT